jgi:hypothetical protein
MSFPEQQFYYCGFEDGLDGATSAGGLTTERAHTGTHSVLDSWSRDFTGLEYPHDQVVYAWLYATTAQTVTLTFNDWEDTIGIPSQSFAIPAGQWVRVRAAFETMLSRQARAVISKHWSAPAGSLFIDDVALARAAYEGTGAVTVSASGGDVTLDAGVAPYGTATVNLPLIDEGDIEKVDPRDNLRVTLNARVDDDEPPRVFNLGLRSREVDHKARSITLELATDEAMAMDYAPLETDLGAFAHQASLRAVCNYALGKIGASLAPGAWDADVTTLTDATNLMTNGAARVNINGWTGTGTMSRLTGLAIPGLPGVTTAVRCAKTGADTGGLYYQSDSIEPFTLIQAGKTYAVSAWVRSSVQKSVRLSVQMRNTSGAQVSPNIDGQTNVVPAGQWRKLTLTFTAHAGAARLGVYSYLAAGSWAAGNTYDMTGVAVRELDPRPGVDNFDFFDGASVNTANYAYAWTGAAGNSSATRTALVDRSPELLIWEPGVSAWKFLEPMTSAAGLRLFCDETRTWRLIDPSEYSVPGRISVAGWNATEGRDTISRDDPNIYCTGVVVRYRWRGADGQSYEKLDSAGAPGLVLEWLYERPYPGPGAAAAILARRSGQGRVQDVTALADYSVTPSVEASISLPGTVDQVGRAASVTWGLTDGLMRLGTRGLVDAPPDSWIGWDPEQEWAEVPDAVTWESLGA